MGKYRSTIRVNKLNFNGKISHISLQKQSKQSLDFSHLCRSDDANSFFLSTSCMDPVGAGFEHFKGGRKKKNVNSERKIFVPVYIGKGQIFWYQ